ncbi:MAG: N-acetyltransferase family protein [Actinomycetales bacterium]
MARGDIRPAQPSDVEQVLQMIRELAEYERAADEVRATPQLLTNALFADAPAVHALVVEGAPGEPLLGFAIYFLNFSTWLGKHGVYLEDLYVKPDERGQGHGKRLLQALAGICVERGYGRLEWWVLDWNEPALGFYRSIGAVPMDEWTVHRVTGTALTELAGPEHASPEHSGPEHADPKIG